MYMYLHNTVGSTPVARVQISSSQCAGHPDIHPPFSGWLINGCLEKLRNGKLWEPCHHTCLREHFIYSAIQFHEMQHCQLYLGKWHMDNIGQYTVYPTGIYVHMSIAVLYMWKLSEWVTTTGDRCVMLSAKVGGIATVAKATKTTMLGDGAYHICCKIDNDFHKWIGCCLCDTWSHNKCASLDGNLTL